MSFGERLKELREERNMTQQELGKLLGVSGRQVGNYEANKQFLRDEESFLKIIRYFDISADYLFGLSDDRNYNEAFESLKDYKSLTQEAKSDLNDYIKYLLSKR